MSAVIDLTDPACGGCCEGGVVGSCGCEEISGTLPATLYLTLGDLFAGMSCAGSTVSLAWNPDPVLGVCTGGWYGSFICDGVTYNVTLCRCFTVESTMELIIRNPLLPFNLYQASGGYSGSSTYCDPFERPISITYFIPLGGGATAGVVTE